MYGESRKVQPLTVKKALSVFRFRDNVKDRRNRCRFLEIILLVLIDIEKLNLNDNSTADETRNLIYLLSKALSTVFKTKLKNEVRLFLDSVINNNCHFNF